MAKAEKKVESTVSVRPVQAAKMIKHCMRNKRPVMLWGPPGIGKSDIIKTIGKSYEMRDDDGKLLKPPRPVIDIRLLLHDPTDLKGMPYYDFNEGRMKWSQPSELPMVVSWDEVTECDAKLAVAKKDFAAEEAKKTPDHKTLHEIELRVQALESRLKMLTGAYAMKDAILFLDELTAAPQTVQGAAYQLILDRRIGEYVLPDGVDVIAAGNRETDRGVSFRMPKPLQNRFIHMNLDVNFEDWQGWAVNNQVNADVVGFLSSHTHHLFDFDPKSASNAFATPRSWKFLSDLMSNADDFVGSDGKRSALFPLVAGTIGDGLATEFMVHIECAAKLPAPMDILTGKDMTELKIKEISAMYSLVIAMCYRLKDTNVIAKDNAKNGEKGEHVLTIEGWYKYVDNFFTYMLDNFQAEMCVLGAKIALKEYNLDINPKMVPSFKRFFDKYGEMILDKNV